MIKILGLWAVTAFVATTHAQLFVFTFSGSDASKTVTVTGSGTVTATSSFVLSAGSFFYNNYSDFFSATAPSNDFPFNGVLTLHNVTQGSSKPITGVTFLNSVDSGDVASFNYASPTMQIAAGDELSLSGTATFTLPPAFDFSDYFTDYGTYPTAQFKNPFGTGPDVVLAAPVPEPPTQAAVAGVLLALGIALKRWRTR